MSLSVNVRTAPGLFSVDDADLSLEKPYKEAIADFLDTPGIAGTDIAAEVQEIARTVAKQTTNYPDEGARWNTLRDALKHLFLQERHTPLGSEQQPIELESYWMTLPDVQGASVEINITGGQSAAVSATLTIAGIGGGGQFTIDLKQGLSHKTTRCEKVLVKGMATFEKIEVTRHDKPITTYPRLIAIDTDNLSWDFRRETPPFAADPNEKPITKEFNIPNTDGSTTISLSIDKKTTWNTSVGLSFPNLGGINANVSTQLTYQTGFELKNELPPGHQYVAKLYKKIPAYIWTVQT